MNNNRTQKLKTLMEVTGFAFAIIAFVLNDFDKLKDLTFMQYIIEHWNWWLIALLFAVFIKILRYQIKEDIKEVQNDLVKSTQDLQKIFMPDLAINNIFIREVLIKSIKDEDFYKLLETAVFEKRIINIPDLEKFGIEEKYINRLRKDYHTIEAKKLG